MIHFVVKSSHTSTILFFRWADNLRFFDRSSLGGRLKNYNFNLLVMVATNVNLMGSHLGSFQRGKT